MNELFAPFLRQLEHDLKQPLPGRSAQYGMAPQPRNGGSYSDEPRPDTRRGGVLILLYPKDGALHIPLTLRANYSGVHSGQVSLPGGGQEAGDTDLATTAIREAYEEIGVLPERVTPLGYLSPLFVFASNYLVQPTVAWTPETPEFHPDPYEVALLLETPLLDLLDPDKRRNEVWQLRGQAVQVPYFSLFGQSVWGATAMMLSEFVALPAMHAALIVQTHRIDDDLSPHP